MTDFITAPDVASMTGFTSAAAFLLARNRLERTQGFPPPMPTCLRPLKWRASAITAWLAAQGQIPATTDPIQTGTNVHLLNEARRA